MPPFTDGNFEETKWYPVRDQKTAQYWPVRKSRLLR